MKEYTREEATGDLVIGEHNLNHRVAQALWEAAEAANHYHDLGNGGTALYWHLIAIVEAHIRKEDKK